MPKTADTEEPQTQRADKTALLAADETFETEEHVVPGVGTLLIRPLSRAEQRRVYSLHEANPNDVGPAENFMVARAVVEPKLTVDDVEQWAKGKNGRHIEQVVTKINELSGIEEGAGKEATERFLDE